MIKDDGEEMRGSNLIMNFTVFFASVLTFLFLTSCSNKVKTETDLSVKSYRKNVYPSIEIKNWGIFSSGLDEEKIAKETNSGFINLTYSDPILVKKTTTINAKVGIKFGIQYLTITEIVGENVVFKIRVIHPPMKNPQKDHPWETDQWKTERTGGTIKFSGWSFDDHWELIPGIWRLEVVYKGKVLGFKEFNIVVE